MNWPTIGSAPKDGTEIIGIYYRPADDMFAAQSYGPWTIAFEGGKWRSSWDRSEVVNYMSDFGTEYKEPDCEPTHWQPMPSIAAPPSHGFEAGLRAAKEVAMSQQCGVRAWDRACETIAAAIAAIPIPAGAESEVTVEELALDLMNARRRMNGLDELTSERMKKIGVWPLKQETLFVATALLATFGIKKRSGI